MISSVLISIFNFSDPLNDLIEYVYHSILQNFNVPVYFQERAILAPRNVHVQEVNDGLLSLFPGDENEYLSSDNICNSEDVHEGFNEDMCSPDVLNGLKILGLPNHKLVLKVGVPVILLRNIDQKKGLCNGTRLQIVSLGHRVIEAKVLCENNIGELIFLLRFTLSHSDKKIPFKFNR